jgi:hypothetical protein
MQTEIITELLAADAPAHAGSLFVERRAHDCRFSGSSRDFSAMKVFAVAGG